MAEMELWDKDGPIEGCARQPVELEVDGMLVMNLRKKVKFEVPGLRDNSMMPTRAAIYDDHGVLRLVGPFLTERLSPFTIDPVVVVKRGAFPISYPSFRELQGLGKSWVAGPIKAPIHPAHR